MQIGSFEKIEGLQAVPVKKGDRLPTNTNGVIDKKTVEEGKRVTLDGNTLKVTVPSQIKEAKGFKYRDTFMHKGIETNPWGGGLGRGLHSCLGFAWASWPKDLRTCVDTSSRRSSTTKAFTERRLTYV